MRVVLYYDLLRFSPCSIDLFISEHISPPTIYVYSPLYEDFYTIILSYTSPHRLGACWQKVPYLRARVESIFILALVNTASHFAIIAGSAFAFLFSLLKSAKSFRYYNWLGFCVPFRQRKSTKSFRYYSWLGFRLFQFAENAPSHFSCINSMGIGEHLPVLAVWENLPSISLY